MSAADPSGPARSPPKIPPSRTPPLPPDLRRKSGGLPPDFRHFRRSPSGSERPRRGLAETPANRTPPDLPPRTKVRQSAVKWTVRRTSADPPRTKVRGGLSSGWRTFMELVDSSGLLNSGGHLLHIGFWNVVELG